MAIILIAIGLAITVIIGIIFTIVANKNYDDVKLHDNVYIINKEDIKNLPISVSEDKLIFATKQHYSNNDIIVSGITDIAPNGFMRKVVKTNVVDNQYVVETTNACLTDVFEEAHVSKVFSISDEAVTPVNPNEANIGLISPNNSFMNTLSIGTLIPNKDSFADLFTLDIKENLTKNISVTGSVGYRPFLNVDFDIENHEIEFSMSIRNTTSGRLAVELGAEKEFEKSIEIYSKNLPTAEFVVGTVPIVITNSVSATLDGAGGIRGSLGTEITLDYENKTGFRYSSLTKKVEEIKENSYLGDGLEWNTKASASANVEAGVFIHIVSKLYDSTGVDLAAGIVGSAEAEITASPNNTFHNLNYTGNINLALTPKLKGNIVVTVPIIDYSLIDQPLFETALKPIWEKNWNSDTTIVGKNSKISLLVFEPGWSALGVPDEFSDLKWWDKSADTERPSFYEKDAIENLKGNAKTDWILKKDTFSNTRYHDGSDDVEGLTVTYYEKTYNGKSDLNCQLVCSPQTRWRGAFVKVYIDEEYFTTVEYPNEPEYLNEYVWEICSIKDKKFNIVNSTKLLNERKIDETTKNEKEGQVNGVLMVLNYAYCQKLSFSTIDDDLYLKPNKNDYSLAGNRIISPVLDLYKDDIKTATVSVVDYDCSTVEKLNSSYKKAKIKYEVKDLIIADDCIYSYIKSENGEILPVVRVQLYIGGMCLYPIIHFDSEIKSEKELKRIIDGLKWTYEWKMNNN